MSYDELQRRFPPGRVITFCGSQRWRVQMPTGRDPAGKRLYHAKSLRGSKADAQSYVNWITGLVTAGQNVTTTVSQTELRMPDSLQRKADKFREKLQAAVRDGAKVEPGPLELALD